MSSSIGASLVSAHNYFMGKLRSWLRLSKSRPFVFLVPPLCFSVYSFLVTTKLFVWDESPTLPSIDCLRNSSNAWFDSPKYGNVNDDVETMLEEPSEMISALSATICDDQSPFSADNNLHDSTVWAARLIYLTVYEHQYGAARPEFLRQKYCRRAINSNLHCPDAKFLVLSLQNNGIGANLRLGAVPALMAALATDRILVFVNNAPSGERFLREPWALASCPRRDAQCVFRPLSPCVLTRDEIGSAHILNRSSTRQIFRWGRIPADHSLDRVLVLHFNFRPQRQPENLPLVLHGKTEAVIKRLAASVDEKMLRAASELILREPGNFTGFSYYGEGSVIFHSLLLFLLRPRESIAIQMKETLAEMFPSEFVPENSIGMPIRGE